MQSKEIITAPKADAITSSDVFDSSFACGALYFIMKEEWKDVVGFEGLYQISNLGRIKSLGRMVRIGENMRFVKPRFLKPILNRGYYGVMLSKNEIRKNVRRYRLMAEAFIPNPEKLPQINHINGVKTDDALENIEWISPSGNTQHAYDNGLTTCNIPVVAINRTTRECRSYKSYANASRDLRVEPSSISRVVAGKAKHVNNWVFKKQLTDI